MVNHTDLEPGFKIGILNLNFTETLNIDEIIDAVFRAEFETALMADSPLDRNRIDIADRFSLSKR